MNSCIPPALDLSRDDEQFLSASDLRKRFSDASPMWLERLIENDPTFPAAFFALALVVAGLEPSEYRLTKGALYPIFSAFRNNLVLNENGEV